MVWCCFIIILAKFQKLANFLLKNKTFFENKNKIGKRGENPAWEEGQSQN